MTSLKIDLSDPYDFPEKWNKDDLTALFEKFGEVGDIFIPRDRLTGKDRPFGFVRYFKEEDAEEAIKEMNGYKLQGVEIAVAKAKKSREEAFAAAQAEKKDSDRGDRDRGGGRGRGRSDSRRRSRRSPTPRRSRRNDSRSRSPPRRRRDDSRRRRR
eukprot:TRINITY_DN93470_c0_g1_i1.p1 TRINITY_DN93470_c0_g1~~TRINITY_DN93470_c0_g1_i1.p1  ORF type:complete len:183 (-),score=32.64 TRINITY_DN93470_c0_g1_i1:117-584(-)